MDLGTPISLIPWGSCYQCEKIPCFSSWSSKLLPPKDAQGTIVKRAPSQFFIPNIFQIAIFFIFDPKELSGTVSSPVYSNPAEVAVVAIAVESPT